MWSWIGVEGATTAPETSSWFSQDFWWWWRTTRVIQAAEGGSTPAITEFPSFSFILGDLHPHVKSLPFLILALGLGLRTLASGETFGLRWVRDNKVGFRGNSTLSWGAGILEQLGPYRWDWGYSWERRSSRTTGRGWGGAVNRSKAGGCSPGALVAAVVLLYLPVLSRGQALAPLPVGAPRGGSPHPIHPLLPGRGALTAHKRSLLARIGVPLPPFQVRHWTNVALRDVAGTGPLRGVGSSRVAPKVLSTGDGVGRAGRRSDGTDSWGRFLLF